MKYILIIFIAVYSYGLDLKTITNYKEAIIKAKKSNKNVLFFLKSNYCPWCHKMEKETLKNEKVTNFINSNYIFLKLDKDDDIYPKKFFSDIVPTTYLINPNKEEKITVLYGYVKPDTILEDLSFLND